MINALLKRDELSGLRLDWDMVREVVAAEDGMPVPIAAQTEQVVASSDNPF